MVDEKLIQRLYLDEHKGLRVISKLTGVPMPTIRRHLIKAGCYRGAAHAGHKEEAPSEGEEFAPPPEQGTVENPIPPLEQWSPRGDVSVKRDGEGWVVNLGSGFSAELCSPAVQGEWTGRGIELAANFRLVRPAFSTVCLGVRDEVAPYGDEGSCSLQNAFVPSRFHIKHLCQSAPVLYFKNNNYQAIAVHVSGLTVKEIPLTGLKPILLPIEEKKKLKTGERIDLTWQGDGADLFLCAWSAGALEIIFSNLTSSIYAPLPPETLNRKIKLTLKMRSPAGSFSLSAILGDDEGKTVQEGVTNRSPCTWELARDVGKNGYVRISGKTYGREKIILDESFIEVLA